MQNALEEEIYLLESMYQEVERQLNRTPKSILISKAEELAAALSEVHRRPVEQVSTFENSLQVITFCSFLFQR